MDYFNTDIMNPINSANPCKFKSNAKHMQIAMHVYINMKATF